MSQSPDDMDARDRNFAREFHEVLQGKGIDASPRSHELTHKPPQLPVLLDGKNRLDPLAIRRFAGRPLFTVVDQEAVEGEVLRVFTDKETAREYMSGLRFDEPDAPGAPDVSLRRDRPSAGSPGSQYPPVAGGSDGFPGGVPPDGGFINLFEHVDWGGCQWRILEWERKTVADFTQFWACGFLFWGWVNANNTISSLDCMVSGQSPWVTLWDLTNLGGSGIGIWGRSMPSSLVPFGWNDRASSLQIWYF
jgi:hypothetical protein